MIHHNVLVLKKKPWFRAEWRWNVFYSLQHIVDGGKAPLWTFISNREQITIVLICLNPQKRHLWDTGSVQLFKKSMSMAGSRSASRCLIHRPTNESFEMARHHNMRICKTDAYGAEGLRVLFNVRPDLSAWILKDRWDGFKETKKKKTLLYSTRFR